MSFNRNGEDLSKWYISKLGEGYWAVMPPVEALRPYGGRRFKSGAEALAAFAEASK